MSSSPAPIHHILIPNRSEITCRIAKTASKLGITASALIHESREGNILRLSSLLNGKVISLDYIEAQGGASDSSLYLDQDLIVELAKKHGCDAVHPGYGFLSENHSFARKCRDSGLVWIGPNPEAIEKMGSKQLSKQILERYNREGRGDGEVEIPLIPGYNGESQDLQVLVQEARRIGLPCLIKAAAGGGGKGMRVVRDARDIESAIASARNEARSSFGDERLILERYLEQVKHVEIQIFGDKFGNVIHLFERDCTVQRRHQKIVEESPSPIMTQELRQKMTQAAIQIGKLIQYEGAGTVEFVVDHEQNFYFLEVNTRLQVEHPVTEFICRGHYVDLVEWQIRIAEGYSLPQLLERYPEVRSQTEPYGHAIEVRVCAEDVFNNFQPHPGNVLLWHPNLHGTCCEFEIFPRGSRVRVDAGISSNSTIPMQYDPMVAKIIVWGETRLETIKKLIAVLRSTICFGVKTNIEYLVEVLQNQVFVEGTHLYTSLLSSANDDILQRVRQNRQKIKQLALYACTISQHNLTRSTRKLWRHIPSGWTNRQRGGIQQQRFYLDKSQHEGRMGRVTLKDVDRVDYSAADGLQSSDNVLLCNETPVKLIQCTLIDESNHDAPLYAVTIEVQGVHSKFAIMQHDKIVDERDRHFLHCQHLESGAQFVFTRYSPLELCSKEGSTQSADFDDYKAPMPSQITSVPLKSGIKVQEGDVLLCMESMKMETKILAWKAGVVEYFVGPGDRVASGDKLLRLVEEKSE